jgi:hypothetical protein
VYVTLVNVTETNPMKTNDQDTHFQTFFEKVEIQEACSHIWKVEGASVVGDHLELDLRCVHCGMRISRYEEEQCQSKK